ncbi:hypothetical protein KL86DES1_20932 [uncultured Desulfovibrio sp.]|uniref:Uncharacterized protein n=1 Tax=uncultured Desulfovibrio sp. TaxID=167968 RepID=A0A212L5Z1_9BACT|nr:hypothetical protein KL86DES1_20932 [uncultured Desulfovibrio sp.]VZH33835.1 conserved protein of unknown function [Desulfovibrio sp. 86]
MKCFVGEESFCKRVSSSTPPPPKTFIVFSSSTTTFLIWKAAKTDPAAKLRLRFHGGVCLR